MEIFILYESYIKEACRVYFTDCFSGDGNIPISRYIFCKQGMIPTIVYLYKQQNKNLHMGVQHWEDLRRPRRMTMMIS